MELDAARTFAGAAGGGVHLVLLFAFEFLVKDTGCHDY
jgi:hypothetical protein